MYTPLEMNPFTQRGRILSAEAFTGRFRELSMIAERLEARRPVLVLGAPGIGKSSLLTHLSQAAGAILDRPDLRAFFIDLAVLRSPEELFRLLIQALDRRNPGNSAAAFEVALVEIDYPLLLCFDHLPAALAAGWGQDALERIARIARSNPIAAGGIAMPGSGSSDLMLVVAGGSEAPLLSERFANVTLGAFGPAETRLLIEAYLSEGNVSFGGGEVGELLRLSAGHPAYLQRAAFHLYEAQLRPGYDWRAAYLHEAQTLPIVGAPLPPAIFAGEIGGRVAGNFGDLIRDAARPDRPYFEIANTDRLFALLLPLGFGLVLVAFGGPWWLALVGLLMGLLVARR